MRLFGGGLGRDVGCAAAVGRSGHADARTPARTQFMRLFFHGFAKQGRERDPSSLRFRLQRRKDGSWRADGRPAELSHDA